MNLSELASVFDPTVEEDVRAIIGRRLARPVADLMNLLAAYEDQLRDEEWMRHAKALRAALKEQAE